MPIAASLDALLGQAPLHHLSASFPSPAPFASPELPCGTLRRIAIGVLAAGAAVWVASASTAQGTTDWRTDIVEYTNLYTNETLSPFNPDASLQANELSALGARVGVDLTPESVALPGLQFTVAFILSYDGAPLGAIAYVDP